MQEFRTKRTKPTLLQLKKAINVIFDKYDIDHSGYLDQQEIVKLLNDSLIKQGKAQHTTKAQFDFFVDKCDKNLDGMIQKQELFELLVNFLKVL